MEMALNWPEVKNLIDIKMLYVQYVEFNNRYLVYASDDPFIYMCEIQKDGGDDVTEFEADFKAGANRPQTIAKSATQSQFVGKQITIPADPTPSGICEWEFDDTVYLNKVIPIVHDAEWGDKIDFSVHLKSNDYEVAKYADGIYVYNDEPCSWFQGNGAGEIPNYCKVRCTYIKGDDTTDAERKFIVIAEFLT
jgi:hypothetical protein